MVRSDRLIPATKKMAEILFFIYQKEYKIDIEITRPSRVIRSYIYGGQKPDLADGNGCGKGGTDRFQ